MKRIAGLLVLSEDAQGPFALLQRRGDWDYEHDQPESYPGACQVTASGGWEDEDEEDVQRTMRRELEEELGHVFPHLLLNLQFLKTISTPTLDREASFYWVKVPQIQLKHIRLHPSSGGLVRYRPGMPLTDLTGFSRETGVGDRSIIAVFPEVKEALDAAFAKLAA